jgi:predicted dehydrogenase
MENCMKFLVIGLGSMGKRRVRNLLAIGGHHVAGFDPRADRRAEAQDKYGIAVFDSVEGALAGFAPDALVISTSPAHHMTYARIGQARQLPCFIEASVVEADAILALHEQTREHGPLMAPSCTMRFFPGPKKVKQLIAEGVIGKVLNINYQTGQYLPDWHPWEKIEDFYVSERATGAGREIVPFELTWLNDIFGQPTPLACAKAKLTDMNADIDDIYHCLLRYPDNVLANVTVEVISRPQSCRELRVLGSTGEIVMSADDNCVRYASVAHPQWVRIDLGGGSVEAGYINPEEPYIAEMTAFVNAIVSGERSSYPNTLLDDYNILQTLYQLETLSESAR